MHSHFPTHHGNRPTAWQAAKQQILGWFQKKGVADTNTTQGRGAPAIWHHA